MSETPRVDALSRHTPYDEIARTLERELAERTREREEARKTMNSHIDHLWGVIHKKELAHEIERDALRAEVERLRGMMNHIYASGYGSGHHDTVEGCYTDVHPRDLDTYFADQVAELVAALTPAEVTKT